MGTDLGLGCGQPLISYICVRVISLSSEPGAVGVLRSGCDGIRSQETST